LLDESGYATDLITDEVEGYLENRSKDKPFFLFIPYNAPHFGKGWNDGRNEPVNIMQPHPDDLARVKWIKDPTRRKYAAKVLNLDDNVGRVLKTIDDAGMRESTIVIFMTDHGGDPNYGGDNTPFRDGKATLFEGGIRVPCLVRWPGVIDAGSETDAVTWAIDWFPTLCSLADVDATPFKLDGMDLTPVLQDESAASDRILFWELGAHAELERGNWLALRQGDWKYVSSPSDGEWLFNLNSDPYEKSNLMAFETGRFKRMRDRAEEIADNYRRHSKAH